VNLYRKGSWRCKLFEDCPAVYTNKPPNCFRRFFWWFFMGVHWEKSD
jgi:hypothetical protein